MADLALMQELLDTAMEAARAAGAQIRQNYDRPGQVREKGGRRNLVTDTDEAAQVAALEVISRRHPAHFILAEEDPAGRPDKHGVWTIPGGAVWAVDPLDGTTNFTTAIPVFCSAVGVALDGVPVAGAIYDPMRDEMLAGARGLGATVNGEPLPPLQPVPLRYATVGLDWSRGKLSRAEFAALLDQISRASRTLRVLGSAALALGYVALNRNHAYFNFGLQPWDTGAAAAIIAEVGGELWHIDGTPWRFGEPAVLAGHPALLEEFVRAAQTK